jgi:hypothetical protein
MTQRRFLLADFRCANHAVGHICLYEVGDTYDMPRALTKRDLVAAERPVDWRPPSIFRQLEVLTELEVVEAEELKALQRHALVIVDPLNSLRTKSESKGCTASLA